MLASSGSIALPIGQLVGGLVLLAAAGEILVQRASHLALSFRVPKAVVGAVIVGFGTSLPELLVSVTAAVTGKPAIALGNVVGSNLANVGLILAVSAVFFSARVARNLLSTDLPLGALAAVVLAIWGTVSNGVSRPMGMVFLLGFLAYLWMSLRHTRAHRKKTAKDQSAPPRLALDMAGIFMGLFGLAAGAHFLVQGASEIARLLGVSERVIGLTCVAVGTSLPELAATLSAARRGESDLAVGNVAGSNLFNLLFVLGTTATIHPIRSLERGSATDFLVLVGFAVLAFPIFSRKGAIPRWHGILLLVGYFAYVATLF